MESEQRADELRCRITEPHDGADDRDEQYWQLEPKHKRHAPDEGDGLLPHQPLVQNVEKAPDAARLGLPGRTTVKGRRTPTPSTKPLA